MAEDASIGVGRWRWVILKRIVNKFPTKLIGYVSNLSFFLFAMLFGVAVKSNIKPHLSPFVVQNIKRDANVNVTIESVVRVQLA